MDKKLILLASALLPFSLPGQDSRVLTDAIGDFKGLANEVRKNNPVLAAGTGEGVTQLVKGFSGRRSSGKGPVSVELPKEQQAELDRRAKAKARPAYPQSRPAMQPAQTPESNLPPITPLVMAGILHPTKHEPVYLSEQSLSTVQKGQSRDEVVAALGEPASTAGIKGLEDGEREVLTYKLAADRTASVRLYNGHVTTILR